MAKKKKDKVEEPASTAGEKDKKSTQQSKQAKEAKKNEKEEIEQEEVEQEEVEQEKEEVEEVEERKAEESYKQRYEAINDKYLRLAAEYDNYRRRTLKERMELTKSAGEDVLINILPVIDDFERALGSIDEAKEISAVKEGVQLIYGKFKDFLKYKGVKEIDAKEKEFDTDLHEAITKIPAPDEKLKGKVVDVIEKGYFLNDKVIRFSKVVVGE